MGNKKLTDVKTAVPARAKCSFISVPRKIISNRYNQKNTKSTGYYFVQIYCSK